MNGKGIIISILNTSRICILYSDVYGSTILHLAAEHGAFGITRAILERKE